MESLTKALNISSAKFCGGFLNADLSYILLDVFLKIDVSRLPLIWLLVASVCGILCPLTPLNSGVGSSRLRGFSKSVRFLQRLSYCL